MQFLNDAMFQCCHKKYKIKINEWVNEEETKKVADRRNTKFQIFTCSSWRKNNKVAHRKTTSLVCGGGHWSFLQSATETKDSNSKQSTCWHKQQRKAEKPWCCSGYAASMVWVCHETHNRQSRCTTVQPAWGMMQRACLNESSRTKAAKKD